MKFALKTWMSIQRFNNLQIHGKCSKRVLPINKRLFSNKPLPPHAIKLGPGVTNRRLRMTFAPNTSKLRNDKVISYIPFLA